MASPTVRRRWTGLEEGTPADSIRPPLPVTNTYRTAGNRPLIVRGTAIPTPHDWGQNRLKHCPHFIGHFPGQVGQLPSLLPGIFARVRIKLGRSFVSSSLARISVRPLYRPAQ